MRERREMQRRRGGRTAGEVKGKEWEAPSVIQGWSWRKGGGGAGGGGGGGLGSWQTKREVEEGEVTVRIFSWISRRD